jgi:hypothetical protein
MIPRHRFLSQLFDDIDRGRIYPLTSTKNIEGVLKEFVDEYDCYEQLVDDLNEWHYIKIEENAQ